MAAEILTPAGGVNGLSLPDPLKELRKCEALLNCGEALSTPLTDKELDGRKFPVDEIGFPLPIYVPDEYRTGDYEFDEHHYWAPKQVMLKKYGDLEKMMRHSRTQEVPVLLHKRFNRHFEHTPLAKARVNRLGHLLLSLARYLPKEAVDVRPDTPECRELTLEERQTMWENDEIHIKNIAGAQKLLIKHVTEQKIATENEEVREDVNEFLVTDNHNRRMILGKKLFRLAAKSAVEPIEPIYLNAWESGLLPRQRLNESEETKRGITKTKAIPKDPHLFIARHVIPTSERMEKRVVQRLHQVMRSRQAQVAHA